MTDDVTRPPAEEIVLYEKDPRTKIATITLNRPNNLNSPTAAARLRFSELVFRANVDDDVKVLVMRGAGWDLGGGADLAEQAGMYSDTEDWSPLGEFGLTQESGVKYPPKGSYRHLATMTQVYAGGSYGMRSLQEFKKISIVEVKGYCYGWHFYQAADADLVISSDDALFGHPAFRYAGWAARQWTWLETMGYRKFAEMLFTGRPFSAQEMYGCQFVNSVVPREALEAETQKYALACARSRPTDVVVAQKTFLELYKQYRGEYMGSVLTGFLESLLPLMANDGGNDVELGDEVFREKGLNNVVKEVDMDYPPEWRLSRGNRRKP